MIKAIKFLFKRYLSILLGFILLVFALAFLVLSISNTSPVSVNDSESINSTSNVETTTALTVLETTTTEVTTYSKKDINLKAKYPYLIKINRSENFTIIYAMDKTGDYSIPYKAFVCSTGSNPMYTPLGTFTTSDMYPWRLMVDYSYSQYAIRINGAIMLHSLPYYEQSPDTLKYEEYNKLGHAASLGCIRYQLKDIKWIYNNCPKGTKVIIYSDSLEIPPLEIPAVEPIDENSPYKNWDPTDTNKNNPWKNNSKE